MVLRNLPRFLQATNSDEACGEDARGVSKTRAESQRLLRPANGIVKRSVQIMILAEQAEIEKGLLAKW